MIDLVSAKDLNQLDGALRARIEVWTASVYVAFIAVPVTLLFTEWSLTGLEFWRGFFLALTTGTVFGVIATLLGSWAGQHRVDPTDSAEIRRVLANESPVVAPAPEGATARALCAVWVPDGQIAGGFLYVCRDSLVFQPHQPVPRWPRQRARPGFPPVVLGPGRTLRLAPCWLLPRPWWQQPFLRHPRPALECASADCAIILVLPPAAFLEPILQTQIDHLRSSPRDSSSEVQQ